MDVSTGRMDVQEHLALSVIIVNYNGMKYLSECIESVRKHVTVNSEIIVVDNGSSDESILFMTKEFPDVILVACNENRGFGYGNNVGAKHAKGKHLLLLNVDTVLLGDVEPAIQVLESSPQIGIIGAKMLGPDDQYRFSAGYFPTLDRLLKISSLYRKDGPFLNGDFPSSPYGTGYLTDWVEASFMLTKRSLWEELEGMDEKYFMYGEDIDYCKRASDLGYATFYVPSIVYRHFGGFSDERISMVIKGFIRYHNKYSGFAYKSAVRFLLYVGLLTRAGVSMIMFVSTRTRKHRLKATLYFQTLMECVRYR